LDRDFEKTLDEALFGGRLMNWEELRSEWQARDAGATAQELARPEKVGLLRLA